MKQFLLDRLRLLLVQSRKIALPGVYSFKGLTALIRVVSSVAQSFYWVRSLRGIGLGLLTIVLLSGCVKADANIRFESPNRGEIIQHIQIGERLKTLSGDTVQQWVRTIERQAVALGGQVQHPSKQDLTVKIPFNNSDDLQEKFNQFFAGIFVPEASAEANLLPTIQSSLTIAHSNLLLLERHHLQYNVDLRSLGLLSANGDILVSPASLITLEFKLETPWGARSVVKPENIQPRSRRGSHELIWTLVPGENNLIETVFWMPNPIGIGAIVILLLVFVGKFLKQSQSSDLLKQQSVS